MVIGGRYVDWQWLVAPFEWYGNFKKKRSLDSETQREKQSQCLCMCLCVLGEEVVKRGQEWKE